MWIDDAITPGHSLVIDVLRDAIRRAVEPGDVMEWGSMGTTIPDGGLPR
jgi:hypothetical protein